MPRDLETVKAKFMSQNVIGFQVGNFTPHPSLLGHKVLPTAEDVLKTLPFFGGEPDDEKPDDKPDNKPDDKPDNKPENKTESKPDDKPGSSAGGDDPAKQISDLLSQVTELNKTVKTLGEANAKYEEDAKKASRAQMSKEEAQAAEIEDLQKQIAQQDAVIRHVALVNAITNDKEVEWHSPRHVLNELDLDSFDLDIDLENGTATVTGIEKALKEVKTKCPWLVSKDKSKVDPQDQNQNVRRTLPGRPSGGPVTGSGADSNKATRRQQLKDRYPVISHGRG